MTLPWPPSVNTYWRHPSRGPLAGRHLISEAGRTYRSAVAAHVMHKGWNVALTNRLSIKIDAYPPDRRKRDLDNILKSLLDAITHSGVIIDDSQFDAIQIYRKTLDKPGRVDIFITPLELQ